MPALCPSLLRSIVLVVALATVAAPAQGQVPLIRPATPPTAGAEPEARAPRPVEAPALTTPSADVAVELRRLVLYAADSARALYEAWRVHESSLVRARSDSASRAVTYALLGRDERRVDDLVEAVPPADSGDVRRGVARLRHALDEAIRTFARAPTVTLFAKGDVKGVATGQEGAATAATGALGISVTTTRALVQASLTLASTADTLTSGFGAAVLAPGGGKALSSGVISTRIGVPSPRWLPSSLHAYASASSATWRDTVRVEGQAPEAVAANAVILGAGLLAWHDIACCQVLGNQASLSLEWGVGYRNLGGDIRTRGMLLDSTLDTRVRNYWGPEVGLQVTVGRVLGSLQLYRLRGTRKADVDGLTGFQVVTAFTVAADVFTGPLTR